MALSIVWFIVASLMRRDDESSNTENIWHRGLLGLFLMVLLLIVGSFGLSMWELRHDQEITTIGMPKP